jgi:HPt (histidine-containing phosphotransfer) domain-containing protein
MNQPHSGRPFAEEIDEVTTAHDDLDRGASGPAGPAESTTDAEAHAQAAAAGFDFQAALRRLEGDRVLFRKMAGFYLEDSPGLLQDIADSLETGDRGLLIRAAHSLRGLSANFDAAVAIEAARAVEDIARNGDLNDAAEPVRILEAEVDRLNQALLYFQDDAP